MAKLFFIHSVMNAGKSLNLLGVKHNYEEQGGRVLLFTSAIDNRSGVGVISSRLGVSAPAVALGERDDLFDLVNAELAAGPIKAVLMDEVQFMTPDHVRQASRVVDELNLPVMAYGLKNNVFGELFSASVATLLALADEAREIKTTCHCGRKATMILRYDREGRCDKSGSVVEIGGDGRYVSVCRPHWKSDDIGPACRAALAAASADEAGDALAEAA